MIRNLLLALALTLGVVISAQADSDTSAYGAVTSSSGEVVRSSNSEVVTVGDTLVEPDKDRDNADRGRPSPAGAPAGATSGT
jgi:hypothetical protein